MFRRASGIFSFLLPACLMLLVGGCQFWGQGQEGAAADSVAVAADSVAARDSLGVDRGLQAGADSARSGLPAGGPGSEAAAAASPEVSSSSDSLARAVAALVLAELSGKVRDTLVVRMDTAGVRAASDSLASRPVEQIQEDLRNVGARVVAAILLVIVVYYLLRGLLWVLEAIADRSAARRLFFKRLIPIVRMFAWALVIYFIIASIFQVDKNGLLAASAALGVGIGLAAQDLIKNLLGGIIIIFDAPFQVGDKVRVGETYGEVKSIGLRSTRIVTLDDNLVSVPNSQVVDGQVANANAGVLDCQVVTKLYLPGWTDAALAKQIAFEAAANSRYVFLDKPIVVLVKDEFKETFLTEIVVKAYVLDHLYESRLASDITETAKMGFLKAGLLYPVYGLQTPEDLQQFFRGEGAS